MKLEEANIKINNIANIKFGQLFSQSELATIGSNKGRAGQLLELALGLKLSSANQDFEDGELKTNKCDRYGHPEETVFIMQISQIFDNLIEQEPFEQSALYNKIKNILYVPVCKEGQPQNWMFLPSIHVDLSLPKFSPLLNIWRDDYYYICKELKNSVETGWDHCIHTTSGTHIQVRSKDAKTNGNYHPIHSYIYGRDVSNKNYAFYFQKQFVYDIHKMNA